MFTKFSSSEQSHSERKIYIELVELHTWRVTEQAYHNEKWPWTPPINRFNIHSEKKFFTDSKIQWTSFI